MKIHSNFVEKIAYLDTDEGCFKVYANGAIHRWVDDETTHQSDWADMDKHTSKGICEIQCIDEIRRIGLTMLL